mmetsp:Transcript_33340/g.69450  ORF Transcript_33340/g.69450 Transcript_33340/m.69450 type:complete len:691 (-) Transcript_33340:929-3001(-)
MSSRKTGSQYERRAARQRQMDQMEAEASGTRASMQLETGSQDAFVSMRQRNQETARRFLYDEDEGVQTTAAVKNTTTAANLFGNRDEPGMEGVNLMDHETGIYTNQDNSFTGRLKRFFLGDAGPGEHDAIAADSEVYLGDRASRTSSILVRLRLLLCSSKQRVLACCIVFVALFGVAFYSMHLTKGGPSEQQKLFSENSSRFKNLWDVITLEGISDPQTLLNVTSPQARALRWIAYSDPARLEPEDPVMVQRYALAVFFFNSYMFFAAKSGAVQKIDPKDEQAQGVPIAGWYVQQHWLTESGICRWHGVQCAVKQIDGVDVRQYDANDKIYALNLTHNYVWGTIPDEVKGLQTIERLDLSRNRISGNFPGEVRRLTKLKVVKFQDNRMTGELPREIGFMQAATELDVSRNEFSGSVPTEIARLSNLHTLDMSKNKFTKQIPMLRGLHNLRYLYLDENDFSGTVPFSFAEIPEIRELHFAKNRIGGTIAPEMQTLSKLRIFNAHDNNIQGKFPNKLFATNVELEQVSLQFNNMTGSIPTDAGHLTGLHTLQMHDNMFTGSFPTEWKSMESLEVLHLQNNQMHGKLPPNIAFFKKLKELWLANNQITGPVPTELIGCTALESAYLDHNKFSGAVPPELGQMKQLQTLRLEGNDINGNVPNAVCDLKTYRLRFFSMDCESEVTCPSNCCDKCY